MKSARTTKLARRFNAASIRFVESRKRLKWRFILPSLFAIAVILWVIGSQYKVGLIASYPFITAKPPSSASTAMVLPASVIALFILGLVSLYFHRHHTLANFRMNPFFIVLVTLLLIAILSVQGIIYAEESRISASIEAFSAFIGITGLFTSLIVLVELRSVLHNETEVHEALLSTLRQTKRSLVIVTLTPNIGYAHLHQARRANEAAPFRNALVGTIKRLCAASNGDHSKPVTLIMLPDAARAAFYHAKSRMIYGQAPGADMPLSGIYLNASAQLDSDLCATIAEHESAIDLHYWSPSQVYLTAEGVQHDHSGPTLSLVISDAHRAVVFYNESVARVEAQIHGRRISETSEVDSLLELTASYIASYCKTPYAFPNSVTEVAFNGTKLLIHSDNRSYMSEDRVFPIFADESAFLAKQILNMDLLDMHILDVGTGSGIFAVSAASRGAQVTAIDVTERSMVAARLNCFENRIQNGKTSGSVHLIKQSASEFFASNLEIFDLIVANPPFVPAPVNAPLFIHSHGGIFGDSILLDITSSLSCLSVNGKLIALALLLGETKEDPSFERIIESLPKHNSWLIRYQYIYEDSISMACIYLPAFGDLGHAYTEWAATLATEGCHFLFYLQIEITNLGPGEQVEVELSTDLDLPGFDLLGDDYSGNWFNRGKRLQRPTKSHLLALRAL